MAWTSGKRGVAALVLLVPAAALILGPRALVLMPAGPEVPAVTALDTALSAYQAGDFGPARKGLKPLADRGSAIAETMLGVMAARGQGGAADPAAATGWWLRAANRGYAPAQLALAKALAEGKGVTADREEALVWAELAADGGGDAAAEARALADGLAKGLGAAEMEDISVARAAWRPWPE